MSMNCKPRHIHGGVCVHICFGVIFNKSTCKIFINITLYRVIFLQMVADLMSKLESIFVKSYLKGDKTTPNHTPQTCNLHRAAIESWSLLLSISTPSTVRLILDRYCKSPSLHSVLLRTVGYIMLLFPIGSIWISQP